MSRKITLHSSHALMLRATVVVVMFAISQSSVVSAKGTDRIDLALSILDRAALDSLPSHVVATIGKIRDPWRRRFAVASYLRRSDELFDNWSWTRAEVASYRKTEEFRAMLADIENVRSEFSRRNPGYHLAVTIDARSLETQIEKWNSVSSVGKAARIYRDSCLALLADSIFLNDSVGSEAISSFLSFARVYEPEEGEVPTVALPGLSKHGQLKAFDFKVMKGGRMIAGAHSATIEQKWESAGWTTRLNEAVTATCNRFDGPLDEPYEPWHYNYFPNGVPVDVLSERSARRNGRGSGVEEVEIEVEAGTGE